MNFQQKTGNKPVEDGKQMGRIHSFQSLGTMDGPGLRCVVFLQGCPHRCLYCHNPDTWDFQQGTQTSVEELLQKICRYKSYFGDKGGVTVSGGEPLCQSAFLEALIDACHQQQISVAVDTGGSPYNSASQKVLAKADLVLLDLKFLTEQDYKTYKCGNLKETLAALAFLNSMQKPTWLRQVVLTGVHDQEEHLAALKQILADHSCIQKIELLPFRKLCLEKYELLGLEFPLRNLPETSLESIRALSKKIPQI